MVPARTTNGLAIASLVCGVAGFAVCGLISIAAIPLGLIALRQIRDSDGQEEGRGFAIAGISIGGALLAIAVLAIGIIIVIAATTEPSDPYDDEPYQPTTTFSVPG
jgi:hypothetical protein